MDALSMLLAPLLQDQLLDFFYPSHRATSGIVHREHFWRVPGYRRTVSDSIEALWLREPDSPRLPEDYPPGGSEIEGRVWAHDDPARQIVITQRPPLARPLAG